MRQVNIYEAKTQLSHLVDLASQGEEVTIARAGKPVAKLVPISRGAGKRRLGLLDGEFVIPDDFDAPLPDEMLRAFEAS